MTFPVLSANTPAPSGYNLTKSLRFRSSASAYLSRTPSSASSRQIWTYSAWVKLGNLNYSCLFGSGTNVNSGNGVTEIGFQTDNSLAFTVWQYISGTQWRLTTNAIQRDPASWYHLIVAVDTTQATASNRVKMYINGVQQTSLYYSSYPSQNYNTGIDSTDAHNIGRRPDGSNQFDGYMTNIQFIDGQALAPTAFGTFNSYGVWQPINYGGSYGTNGFYLPFSNKTSTTTLGYDFSPNGNNWTTNNISLTAGSTYDSMTDVPTLTSATTANFDTFNPLASASAPTNGNLSAAGTAPQLWRSTIALPTTGKFYAELYCTDTNGSQRDGFGIQKINTASTGIGLDTAGYAYCGALGQVFTNGSATISSLSTWTNGDTVQIAIDCATGYVWFGKNNTWQASGNPATGANPMLTITGISDYCVAFGTVAANTWYASGNINFGQQPFTYTPPSGFVALNTYNLPTSTIVAGNKVMDATTYTGNGSTQSIANTAGFKPDLVWVKSRSAATDHKLTDSVRGVTKALISDTTGAETTDTNGLTAFGANGFTLGTDTNYNNNAATYVGWQWQAGQGTTSSNTNGSITSTVSVNATAGFSIVTYTGTGAAATIGHSLGIAPKMIICKYRGSTSDWVTYHASLGAGNAMFLNLTDAVAATTAAWNNTTPTSSVFSVAASGNSNPSGGAMVAYCWSEIAGFSSIGSYTGNGSADGVFSYLGFKPRLVLIKRTDTTGNWIVWDTARNTYNVMGEELYPNLSNAGSTATDMDVLSNGFKLRNTTADFNANGGTYIYAAWASNPFKNNLAQ